MTNLGGNLIESGVLLPEAGQARFASSPYVYFFQACQAGDVLENAELASCTVYVLHKAPRANIVLPNGQGLQEGDVVQFENQGIQLRIQIGLASFFIAGTVEPSTHEMVCRYTPASAVYKVTKPWGHELWLNGRHSAYALKRLLEVKAGTRTSLQYHEHKHETTVFFQGTAALHYRSNSTASDKQPGRGEAAQQVLEPITCATTPPPAIHRVEAITDLVYYEASTLLHLDDVIRLQDDGSRPSAHRPGAPCEHSADCLYFDVRQRHTNGALCNTSTRACCR